MQKNGKLLIFAAALIMSFLLISCSSQRRAEGPAGPEQDGITGMGGSRVPSEMGPIGEVLPDRPILLAHRGLAQNFNVEEVEWNTNTARVIYPPEHPFLENTIPSMREAFACGADIVEFDVRLTRDNELAVFHDYLLEYRTDGSGLVSDHTMEELRKLDVGYGYTADDGRTYPFRGTGVGLLPSIDDVLTAFPTEAFMIHIRDGGVTAARLLDDRFRRMSPERLARISLYGNEEAIIYLRERYPDMKMLQFSAFKKGLIRYLFFGWTGQVPKILRNMEVHFPLRYAKLLWGWPDRFIERMTEAGVFFVLVSGNGKFSSGFDTAEDIASIPASYRGAVWTDRIDLIAPLYGIERKE